MINNSGRFWLPVAGAWAVTAVAVAAEMPSRLGPYGDYYLLFALALLAGLLLLRRGPERVTAQPDADRLSDLLEMEALVDGIPDVVYRLDERGRIEFVNGAAANYGYEPGDLRGKSIFDLIHPEDRKVVKRWFTERRQGERRARMAEIRLLAAETGSRAPRERTCLVDSWSVCLPGPDGRPVYAGSRGIVRDITGRKRVLLKLNETRGLFRPASCPLRSAGFTHRSSHLSAAIHDFVNGGFCDLYLDNQAKGCMARI